MEVDRTGHTPTQEHVVQMEHKEIKFFFDVRSLYVNEITVKKKLLTFQCFVLHVVRNMTLLYPYSGSSLPAQCIMYKQRMLLYNNELHVWLYRSRHDFQDYASCYLQVVSSGDTLSPFITCLQRSISRYQQIVDVSASHVRMRGGAICLVSLRYTNHALLP